MILHDDSKCELYLFIRACIIRKILIWGKEQLNYKVHWKKNLDQAGRLLELLQKNNVRLIGIFLYYTYYRMRKLRAIMLMKIVLYLTFILPLISSQL